MSRMAKEKPRPGSLKSVTSRVPTGHGTLFVTVAYKVNKKPFEVFANIGKAGGHEHAWIEALCRCISMGLRYGVPARVYIEQLRGITCDSGVTHDSRFVHSPADAIATVLEEFTHGVPSRNQSG